jgi:hypothetical protein
MAAILVFYGIDNYDSVVGFKGMIIIRGLNIHVMFQTILGRGQKQFRTPEHDTSLTFLIKQNRLK